MNGDTMTIVCLCMTPPRWIAAQRASAAMDGEHATSIRFHRACSWMARVEQMPGGRTTTWADQASGSRSIRSTGSGTRASGNRGRIAKVGGVRGSILRLDRDGYVRGHCRSTNGWSCPCWRMSILAASFGRSRLFNRAKQSRKAAYNAQTWYIEERWGTVLDQILDRVYLSARQLVHGARDLWRQALNRTSLIAGA